MRLSFEENIIQEVNGTYKIQIINYMYYIYVKKQRASNVHTKQWKTKTQNEMDPCIERNINKITNKNQV